MAEAKVPLYTIDENGKLTLRWHAGQNEAWDAATRFIWVFSGTQGGKTSFAPWWLWREIMNTYVTGEENDYLAVTATFDLFKLKFLPEMMRTFCDVLKIGRYWAADRLIELKSLDPDDPRCGEFYAKRATDPMWGRIILRSAQAAGGLEAATAKAAVADECGQDDFGVDAYRAIRRRLSLARGRLLGTTTLYNWGWTYDIYRRWTDGEEPDTTIIQFPSYINPNFSMDEFEDARRVMPDSEFAMQYLGEFYRPHLLIYHDFNDRMLVDDFDPPLEWERVVGIDFGGANVAAVFLAYDPYQNYWVAYDELLMGHSTTRNYVERVNQKLAGCPTVTVVGGAKSEDQFRSDWTEAGLYVEPPPVFDLEPGITRGIALIRRNEFRICRRCTGLRRELDSYKRKPDEEGNPTELIINKNRFHHLDGYRYASVFIEDQPLGVDVMTYSQLMGNMEKQYA